jgi:hypothetical protein
MKLHTALRLGRISNLPTVVTNAMAGMALAGAGAGIAAGPLALAAIAAALSYVGGMFLNDAFDAPHDAVSQPFRPIPAGLASRSEVYGWGFGMLGGSIVLFLVAGAISGTLLLTALAGLVLAGTIVAYNRNHKENAFGPLLMGLCRALVYVAAASAAGATPGTALLIGAVLLLAHVMGLTFIAKREGAGMLGRWWPLVALAAAPVVGVLAAFATPAVLPFALALAAADLFALRFTQARPKPQFGKAIPLLIAAITLLDAMLIAGQGFWPLALLAALGFPLTLWLQRWVRGT